jgi:hypothetical protein
MINISNKKFFLIFTIPILVFLISGCQSDGTQDVLKTSKSQLEIRSIQTRYFDASDKKKMLRTVLATLQDLGFVIDKADANLGTCSATKFGGGSFKDYEVRMTVSVRARDANRLLVRANATKDDNLMEDAKPYQDFFAALGKAMFLKANKID